MIDRKRLFEVLDYDAETGVFAWKIARPRGVKPGDIAGSIDADGYRQVSVDGRVYRIHRLAWLWMTGERPDRQIDHICGDKLNNTFANLRPATHGQNLRNRGAQSNNTSGRKGVSWNKKISKWSVQIGADGRRIHLGFYDENKLDEAASAYERAAKELHGEFARV